MPSSNIAAEFSNLRSSLSSVRALISSFQAAVEQSTEISTPQDDTLDPFSIFSDASKLLRAQTTKLSLLLLNKPFSPKEVAFILDALANSVLPALQSALQLGTPEKCTRALHEHARTSLRILWRELIGFLSNIPEDEKTVMAFDESATLSSTGLLWEQCDTLIELGEKGLIYFIDSKIKGYLALLEDAIEELEDWDPGDESDTEDGESAAYDHKRAVTTPTTSDEERLGDGMADLALSAQITLKRRVMKRLRLIRLLYPAVRKRRVATFPALQKTDRMPGPHVEILDSIVRHARHFAEHADELAGHLYADANDATEEEINKLNDEVVGCLDVIKENWEGKEDEFTSWTLTWRSRWEELD